MYYICIPRTSTWDEVNAEGRAVSDVYSMRSKLANNSALVSLSSRKPALKRTVETLKKGA